MKITFVSQYFFPDPFSNTQIVRELAGRGHDLRVVTGVPCYATGSFAEGYSNSARRTEHWEGQAHREGQTHREDQTHQKDRTHREGEIRVERVRTLQRGRSTLKLMANYLGYALMAGIRLARRAPRPDVILVSQLSPVLMIWPAIVHRWRTGAPVVCWVQDLWPESATFPLGLKNPLITRPLSWLCGWLYRKPDLILVQSQAFRPMIERFGVAPEKIRFFPNTAPADHVPRRPEEAPDEAALVPQTGFRLMFAGNIGESQDFDTLIAAAERLRDRPELTWVIVGSGRDMDRVTARVAEKGLADRFHFAGRHPMERMPYFFAHADAMLVSLKATPIFALTVPYKVQGYMACAKPIVAALDGEGARIVREAGCGVTAPASDPDALEGAIRTLLDTAPAARAAMGRAARAWFEAHYAADKIYGDLETWLAEAASFESGRQLR